MSNGTDEVFLPSILQDLLQTGLYGDVMLLVKLHLKGYFFPTNPVIRIRLPKGGFANGANTKIISTEHLVKNSPIQIVAVPG